MRGERPVGLIGLDRLGGKRFQEGPSGRRPARFRDGGGAANQRADRWRKMDESFIEERDRFPIRSAGRGAPRMRRLDRRFEL
ncbi:MAG: hypothetical protein M3178_09175 [Pseudomonadota bacterium]|nr:hypothetical protein [Pseudomonadota bacterium]